MKVLKFLGNLCIVILTVAAIVIGIFAIKNIYNGYKERKDLEAFTEEVKPHIIDAHNKYFYYMEMNTFEIYKANEVYYINIELEAPQYVKDMYTGNRVTTLSKYLLIEELKHIDKLVTSEINSNKTILVSTKLVDKDKGYIFINVNEFGLFTESFEDMEGGVEY